MKELISYLKHVQLEEVSKVIEEISENQSFQNLKKISYLATFSFFLEKDVDFSRFEHSVKTAKALAELSVKNDLTREISEKIILYGFLHDIGHIFFSHIGETIMETRDGFDHEEHGQALMQNALAPIFNKHGIHIPTLDQIPNEHGILLKSHLDIDTMQGILQTSRLVGLDTFKIEDLISHYSYSKEKREWQVNHEGQQQIVRFWNIKSMVYNDFVYSLKNQYVEDMLAKNIRTFPGLSRSTKEEDLDRFIFNDSQFQKEIKKVDQIDEANSFFIETLHPLKKQDLQYLLERLQLKEMKIIEIKKFKRIELAREEYRTLSDIEKILQTSFCKAYRIYVFLNGTKHVKEQMAKELKKYNTKRLSQ